jgi:hypothetical protein
MYQVSDVLMSFEFRSRELSHVLPYGFVGDVRRTADDFSPQRQCALSLDELY